MKRFNAGRLQRTSGAERREALSLKALMDRGAQLVDVRPSEYTASHLMGTVSARGADLTACGAAGGACSPGECERITLFR